jgi:hypothetical protein
MRHQVASAPEPFAPDDGAVPQVLVLVGLIRILCETPK